MGIFIFQYLLVQSILFMHPYSILLYAEDNKRQTPKGLCLGWNLMGKVFI